MVRICAAMLVIMALGPVLSLSADEPAKKLIAVRPNFHEAENVPDGRQAVDFESEQRFPTPREQMYVFWLVGRVLSYPVDKAESAVRGWLEKRKGRAANAPAQLEDGRNPFDSVDFGALPPAAPALAGAAAPKH
jgi:hypothetical protein